VGVVSEGFLGCKMVTVLYDYDPLDINRPSSYRRFMQSSQIPLKCRVCASSSAYRRSNWIIPVMQQTSSSIDGLVRARHLPFLRRSAEYRLARAFRRLLEREIFLGNGRGSGVLQQAADHAACYSQHLPPLVVGLLIGQHRGNNTCEHRGKNIRGVSIATY
jgi:hypothetical protein